MDEVKQYSNSEIRKIGNSIRSNDFRPNKEVLHNLEEYRISYKDDIADVYNRLYDISHGIYENAIVTYRIKRLESIIGKLERFPSMKLDRMWDIAGCRCILNSNKQLLRLKDLIYKEFNVVKENDYITNPQEDGYRSVHLYIRCCNEKNVIEIQLRNKIDHNWATLVEITDLLYDEKLKEKRSNSELRGMHYLFSVKEKAIIADREKIIKCLMKYSFIEKLSHVFSRNYLIIRKQWLSIEEANKNIFILIEASKDEIPKIDVFDTFELAEEQYYSRFNGSKDVNRVLTHFTKPTYKKVSLAYSNYVLTYHQFIEDCFSLLETLILFFLSKRNFLKFKKYYFYYLHITAQHVLNLFNEIKEYNTDPGVNKGQKEWYDDIRNDMRTREEKHKKFTQKMEYELKNSTFGFYIVREIVRTGQKRYERRLKLGENEK